MELVEDNGYKSGRKDVFDHGTDLLRNKLSVVNCHRFIVNEHKCEL